MLYNASVCLNEPRPANYKPWMTFSFTFRERNKGEEHKTFIHLLSEECVKQCNLKLGTNPHSWIITV